MNELNTQPTNSLVIMRERLRKCAMDKEIRHQAEKDFIHTFGCLGLGNAASKRLCDVTVALLQSNKTLEEVERAIHETLRNTFVKKGGTVRSVAQELDAGLQNRAEIIFQQISPFVGGGSDNVIDFGCGDGQVAQMLQDRLKARVAGVDVRVYPLPSVSVPVYRFDGVRTNFPDQEFHTAILTNVLHHEVNNEKILNELDRIVRRRMIVIETVPCGTTALEEEQDKERTFVNDWLYNRAFHNADVPVPGTFETHARWKERFKKHGWRVVHEQDLGFDQPMIRDRHYLLVCEK